MKRMALFAAAVAMVACGGRETPNAATIPVAMVSSPTPSASAAPSAPKSGAPPSGSSGSRDPNAASSVPVVARPLPDADRTVAKLRQRFKACYLRGLGTDPTMQGSVSIRVEVGASGDVTRTTITRGQGLSAEVTACLEGVLKNAHFEPPPDGTATLEVPIRFVASDAGAPPAAGAGMP